MFPGDGSPPEPLRGYRPVAAYTYTCAASAGVTKTGHVYLRRLLVGSAQYILGPFAPDCDLRRWGIELAERGGKNAKKRAVVAVARKLAVLTHRLWKTGEIYDPFYQSQGQNDPPIAMASAA